MIKTQMFNGSIAQVREQLNAIPDLGQEAHLVIYTEVPSEQAAPTSHPTLAEMQAKNAEAIAYLQERMKNVTTDPEENARAEADLAELHENLNRNRIEAGERPLFPE